ncbi:MAG TPA: glycosyltransferase family 2 protein [Bacteroidales bacterium]|nr:glycosyltransferase family 2 protein [Bacteroidales bacterium]
MFSIIIPLYNKAPYIEKALRSVQAQTFREFEVIIIDDGSTDNSFDIANKLIVEFLNSTDQNPPLGGHRGASQPNQGVSTARNNGVKLAKFPYICFLDADDWWAPTFLEEIKRLIEEFPDAGIYGASYYKVKDGKYISANIGVDEGFQQGYINYCQVYSKTMWMPLTSISVCIPKKVFESENGFKPNLKLGEDFDLWIRIAMKYSVAFLNKPLAFYNQDINIENRAVSKKVYNPSEHMLFEDYTLFMKNEEFKYLYERLFLYAFLQYYIYGVNSGAIKNKLKTIHWKNHNFKYYLFYKIIPKYILKAIFNTKAFIYKKLYDNV